MPAAAAALLAALAFSFAAASAWCESRRRVRERTGWRSDGPREPVADGSVAPGAVSMPPTGRWKGMVLGIAAILLGLALAGPPGVLLGVAAAAAVPRIVRVRRAARERSLADEQLTDAVSSMAAGMRAGFSLSQALRFAADEGSPPLAASLEALVGRSTLGMPLGTSIELWSEAQGGRDVRLVAGVLRLHGRSGGDLPVVLDRLVETLRERRSAAREVRSLTAQARLSGAILGFLPLVFFAFLGLTAPQDLAVALRSPAGLTALIVGFVMQGAAFLWIRYLLRLE